MRWYWIDRVIEFRSGYRARAVKHVSLAAECLADHFPAHPILPHSMIIEGMGQTAMLLACEAIGFAQMVLLAKVSSARFHREVLPGESLIFTATINNINAEGVLASAASHVGDRLQGEAELVFTRFGGPRSRRHPAVASMVKMARDLGVFAVGRTADGQPLAEPGPF